jgi:selenocysteine lyase/cysteine desulfurase
MDWQSLRQEMPVTRQWAYLDHAAVAPLSLRAQQALREWSDDLATNGHVHERSWVERIEGVRRLAAHLIQADAENIAFIKNTSEGIGIVAEGFPWQPGDNIVTAAEEYPANIYPWMNLESRGVELRRVPSSGPRIEIDDLKRAIDSRTRIISLSHVEFASGFRNDLDAVGELCRQRRIVFVVDAIQGLGVLPIDVGRMPIDALAADGHKWLLGPEGAGILYMRRDLVERLHPVGIGWNSVIGSRNFSRPSFELKPHAGRWESGAFNVAGIMALGASLALLLEAGVSAISERVLNLTDELCEMARSAGLEVFSSRRDSDRSAIVSLVAPGGDPGAHVRRCRARGIVINQRAGRIRVSPHAYNTVEELRSAIDLIRTHL